MYAKETVLEKRERMEKKMIKFIRLRDHRINLSNFANLMPKAADEKEDPEEAASSVWPMSKLIFTKTIQNFNFLFIIFQIFIPTKLRRC